LFGAHNSQIATLVERQTRYLMLVNCGQGRGDGRRRPDQEHAQAAPGAASLRSGTDVPYSPLVGAHTTIPSNRAIWTSPPRVCA